MKDANLRLRLIVRRHHLPEVRVLFSIGLQDEPTIANLLEHVNNTVPLESPDWGLDDYVVEVQDSHGHAFECLHFQPVNTVLDRDEEVIIRPLFTVDRKKRLLSGRHQISADGKHLIDGVPFGRPRLKVPRGRPPVEIPPLKRRRILFEQEEDNNLDEDDDDEDYQESANNPEAEEGAPFLLTESGEGMGDPGAVRVEAMFDDADNSGEDGQVWSEDEEGSDGDEEEEDLADDENDEGEIDEAAKRELLDELRDIQMENELLGDGDPDSHQTEPRNQPSAPSPNPDEDLARLNKITVLRHAFPGINFHVYEGALQLHDLDEKGAYEELRKTYEAKMTLDETRDLLESLSCPTIPPSNGFDAEVAEAESDAESTNSLVKRYDHHGFPSGSILDGSASKSAAEALRKAGHSIRSPVHTKFDQDIAGPVGQLRGAPTPIAGRPQGQSPKTGSQLKTGRATPLDKAMSTEHDDDDDTSDSSSSDSEEQDDSDEGDGDDGEEDNSDSSGSDSDSDDTSSEEGDSHVEQDSDEDSGPETASTKPPERKALSPGSDSQDNAGTGSMNGSKSRKRRRGPADTDVGDTEGDSAGGRRSSSSETSSDSSSESGTSSSGESSDSIRQQHATAHKTLDSTQPRVSVSSKVSTEQPPEAASKRSPPGQGLTRTKLRNARRKAAQRGRKVASALAEAASLPNEGSHQSLQTNDSEFLKRKEALLEKLAKDNTEPTPCELKNASRGANMEAVMDGAEIPSIQPAVQQVSNSDTTAVVVDPASQRRSKLDVGAGRRMLFGALGLKNPKSKADEDKIRSDLMNGVRPLVNYRISEALGSEKGKAAEHDQVEEPSDDDTETWRSKIIYRAVECCQDGVELSEPPFPFVQRWDPQQKHAWHDRKGKRGGRGKRKQRNQADFYEDDSILPISKKQRVDPADGEGLNYDDILDADPYDPSFSAGNPSDTQDADKEPNYAEALDADLLDSVPDRILTDQSLSQFTDMDDLPSLPKDLATLAELMPSEAKPGMVITWKQMLVSKATNWAPQVLDLTAVIVSVDEGTEELRVVLAKRDRSLDGNEKTFDEDGNRVYDKFEAPDDDDTDGNDAEGYRTIQYSAMMEPRILQQPLPLPQKTMLHPIAELENGPDTVMAESGGDYAPTLDDHRPAEDHIEEHAEADGEQKRDQPHDGSFGSVIPDSISKERTEEPETTSAEILADTAGDVSITDDRRHDISVLIREAGFRADLTPSVAKETRFTIEDLSSPSRQLEETSEAAAAASQRGSNSPGPGRCTRSASAVQEIAMAAANNSRDITPVVAYPHLPVPMSSASSVRSGRQPDNDPSMDWGDDGLLLPSEDLGEEAPIMVNTHVETNDEATSPTPTPTQPKEPPTDNREDADGRIDSSPLPSLEELFCTASSSRPTQSPNKAKSTAAIKSRKPEAKRDLEYEEIMRRVDDSEGWEEDQTQIKEVIRLPPSSIDWDEERGQIKEERWSQVVSETKRDKNAMSKSAAFRRTLSRPSQAEPKAVLKEEESSQSPISHHRKRRSNRTTERFSIPEGSQVVSFLTSSSEPEIEEHYAEDSIDSTYEDPDSDVPAGNGWVRKALPGKSDRARRGVSLNALSAAQARRATGVPKRSISSSNGNKAGRSRRKTSAKF